MAKKITLDQLAAKKYVTIPNIPDEYAVTLGDPENSFDMAVWGHSGNGKSNLVAGLLGMFLTCLPDARCEYVAYEEKHGKSIRDTMINRAQLNQIVGNRISISDGYTYEEVDAEMGKRRSAKMWVFDSAQASGITAKQFLALRKKYIKPKNGKIIFYVSWARGKNPEGSLGESLLYYADIKLFVDKLVAFPRPGRFGGLTPYVIYEPIARMKWGKDFKKIQKEIKDAIKNRNNGQPAKSGRPVLCTEEGNEGSVPGSGPQNSDDEVSDLQVLGSVGSGDGHSGI